MEQLWNNTGQGQGKEVLWQLMFVGTRRGKMSLAYRDGSRYAVVNERVSLAKEVGSNRSET